MRLTFVTQPFEDGSDLRDFLHSVARDEHLMTLRMVVAWAKQSGITRAGADLDAVRDRGGQVLAIVGVSEGGATEQGLRALISRTDEAHVFHDAGRTFHPKVYMANGSERGLLLVGSSNLTAGGLAWNYEASLLCELNFANAEDLKIHDDVLDYFDRLKQDSSVCLTLDDVLVTTMLSEARLMIRDEDKGSKNRSQPDTPEDMDSVQDDAPISIFGKSSTAKRKAPAGGKKVTTPFEPRIGQILGPTEGSPVDLDVQKRWYKHMDGTAAQRPPGLNSKPTGNLRLSQETFAIDHRIYFRDIFFGGLDWQPRPNDSRFEEVEVVMQTVLGGKYLGNVAFKVSHAPHRIAGQNNVATTLHWKPIGQLLREADYSGYYTTLERASGGQFALTISTAPLGHFLY